MKLLVDTHALIWFITNDRSLPKKTKTIIEDSDNSCVVSVASLWEMGIKYSLGRIELKSDLENIFRIIEKSGFGLLPITPEHILASTKLGLHHKDPFDRIIIAQAITEKLTIISKDKQFKYYPVKVIW